MRPTGRPRPSTRSSRPSSPKRRRAARKSPAVNSSASCRRAPRSRLPATCSGSRVSTLGTCSSYVCSATEDRAPVWSGHRPELLPGGPPVVGPRHDPPPVQNLDAVAVPGGLDEVGAHQRDLDLTGMAGIVGSDRLQVPERPLRPLLDQLARLLRGEGAGAHAPEALLDSDRCQPIAEQFIRLTTHSLVARHEHDRAAERAAQGGVDPRLPDRRAVEAELVDVRAGDRVVEDTVGDARPRVHPDEERRVATLLQKAGVFGPLVLNHPFAAGVEGLGQERVEGPALARTVAIHHHDIARPGREGPAHRGVDLLRVKTPRLLEERLAAVALLRLDDAGYTFDVADHVNSHCSPFVRPGLVPGAFLTFSQWRGPRPAPFTGERSPSSTAR